MPFLSTYMDPSVDPTVEEKHLSPLLKKPKMPHATILERNRPQKLRHARINDKEANGRHGKAFENSKTLICKILS